MLVFPCELALVIRLMPGICVKLFLERRRDRVGHRHRICPGYDAVTERTG